LLTPRQAEVVKLAQRGLAAKEIARQLRISKRTVEAHLSEARRRVGVASTVALVGSVIVGDPATDSESSYSCSENAGISEQVITGDGVPSPPRPGRQRRGRPTVMTEDVIAKARLMLPSHSISDIARHLEVSRTTIYAHMGQIQGMGELRAPGPPCRNRYETADVRVWFPWCGSMLTAFLVGCTFPGEVAEQRSAQRRLGALDTMFVAGTLESEKDSPE
jgi:DNA-binding CsgD family transcriptional regulator